MIKAVRCAEKSEVRAETAGDVSIVVLEDQVLSRRQLTFSAPFSPPRSQFQKLCPLGFSRSNGGVRQSGEAGREKEEEAG